VALLANELGARSLEEAVRKSRSPKRDFGGTLAVNRKIKVATMPYVRIPKSFRRRALPYRGFEGMPVHGPQALERNFERVR